MHDQVAQIRTFIVARLTDILRAKGKPADGVTDQTNMIQDGLVDSLGFLEITTAIENEFDVELDFAELDPETFTTVGGLARAAAVPVVGGP